MRTLEKSPFAITRRELGSPFTVVERRFGPLHGSELLLDVDIAGLCGTDIQIARGMRHEEASVIGHEGLCRVAKVGSDLVGDYVVGERVVVNPTSADDATFLLGHTIDGLFQSQILLDERAHRLGQIVRVTVPIDRQMAALIEPLACVIYSMSILKEFKPDTAIVFGDGTIGHLARTLLPSAIGAKDVRLVSREDFNNGPDDTLIPMLRKRCAVVIATPRDSTVNCIRYVLEHAASDVMVDVIGGFAPGNDPLLAEIARTRSANVAGVPHQPVVQEISPQIDCTATIQVTGHRGVSADHLRSAITLLADFPETYRSLVTHIVSPRDAARILTALSSKGGRDYQGRRIIKLAIDMALEGPQ